MLRLPIVGVMGSGHHPHTAWAEPLGRLLAGEAVHLLTGGGGGAMEAVSRAFSRTPGRLGKVIGVLPGQVDETGHHAPQGYPNRWVEIPIHTHLSLSGITGTSMLSRNHINVLSSHALVVLPGGPGTCSEVRLALDYGKPILGWMTSPEQVEGLDRPIPVTDDPAALRAFLRRHARTPKR